MLSAPKAQVAKCQVPPVVFITTTTTCFRLQLVQLQILHVPSNLHGNIRTPFCLDSTEKDRQPSKALPLHNASRPVTPSDSHLKMQCSRASASVQTIKVGGHYSRYSEQTNHQLTSDFANRNWGFKRFELPGLVQG